jgi:hypothetical protein
VRIIDRIQWIVASIHIHSFERIVNWIVHFLLSYKLLVKNAQVSGFAYNEGNLYASEKRDLPQVQMARLQRASGSGQEVHPTHRLVGPLAGLVQQVLLRTRMRSSSEAHLLAARHLAGTSVAKVHSFGSQDLLPAEDDHEVVSTWS